MVYKWMKEHKQQRKIVIFCGAIEICAWIILYFVWHFKGNNIKINNNGLIEKYDFQEVSHFLYNIYTAIATTIVTFLGGSLVSIIKKMFQQIGKIDKEKYIIVWKIRDTYDRYKLMWLSYLQMIMGYLECVASNYIFYIVVFGMQQVFKLKKQTGSILNIVTFSLALGAVIVICVTYIITRSYLRSTIVLLVYCFSILLLICGFFVKNKMELYIIIAFLSIGLSLIFLHMLHKINVVEKKCSLRLCITVTLRNIAISGSLFGVIFFSTTYMYDIANWIYIITLVVDMIFAMLKNESYLKDIYIEIKNENKNVRTKGEIKKIGNMVMYTTTYGIDEMIDCSSVTNIEYSYKISKLEQKLYKTTQDCRAICADLKDIRIIADDYKIKNDWIYFYNICMGEKRVNIYRFSDCVKLTDNTKIIKNN